MSFTWQHSFGTVRDCDRQLDKYLGLSAFNLLCIPCQQQMHLICQFMQSAGKKICCHKRCSPLLLWLSGLSGLSVNLHQAPCRGLTLSQKHFESTDTKRVASEGRGGISQTGKSTLNVLMQHL